MQFFFVRSQVTPGAQQNVKSWLTHVAAHLPASQKVFVAQAPVPLHRTPASAPATTDPLLQLPWPVHCTIDVPSDRAAIGSFLQTL